MEELLQRVRDLADRAKAASSDDWDDLTFYAGEIENLFTTQGDIGELMRDLSDYASKISNIASKYES
ncbi:hypothetical protein [Streptomyces globisporus]|uniref:hypothetical protein n=1 Tax=Streptomyces globisporus TaxID=1908 RepID=UPI00367F6773